MNFSIQSLYNWYRSTIRNPKYRWWLILGTVAYLFSPIDIAPDFIPFIGQIDDAVLLTLLVSEVTQLLTARLKSREQDNTPETPTPSSSEPIDVQAVPYK
jgi:uncharacterized membrane protein YkvA (DUF1232 family)